MTHASQHTLNPGELARERASREFVAPSGAFGRLEEAIVHPTEVRVTLRFAPVRDEGIRVSGSVEAEVLVSCQMCLESVGLAISAGVDLLLHADAALLEEQSLEQDTLRYAEGELDLADLVEDQLLLELPMVARHAGGDCSAALEYTAPAVPEERRPSPFGALRELDLSV